MPEFEIVGGELLELKFGPVDGRPNLELVLTWVSAASRKGAALELPPDEIVRARAQGAHVLANRQDKDHWTWVELPKCPPFDFDEEFDIGETVGEGKDSCSLANRTIVRIAYVGEEPK